jgi:hypothetical protein
MKNFIRSLSVLFAFLAPLSVAGRASATVVWTATFEKGDLSEWAPGTDATTMLADGGVRQNVEVLGEQVYAGKYACKITVHPDDIYGQYKQDRVDIKHPSMLTGEGKDMYLSGHYYLPQDAKTRNEFGFFETGPPYTNWVDVWVEPKTGGGTSIKLGIESNGADLGSVLVWTGDFTPAQWHQIAIHIHWSQDSTKGLVDFWLDGKQVVTGFKHKTKPNGADLFFQTGLHRVLTQPYTESIYFDDFVEADTQDEIKIAAPTQPGSSPDGGGDAGSTAGASGTAGATQTGAAGSSGATGSADATGTAGSPGSAGATQPGSAGATSGSAGATTSGSGGNATTGAAGRSSGSSGCALIGTPNATRGAVIGFLVLLGAVIIARRRR